MHRVRNLKGRAAAAPGTANDRAAAGGAALPPEQAVVAGTTQHPTTGERRQLAGFLITFPITVDPKKDHGPCRGMDSGKRATTTTSGHGPNTTTTSNRCPGSGGGAI